MNKFPSSPQIAFTSEGQSRSVDLYSPEGLQLVAGLWIKLATEYRVMYEPTWLGIPIIQFPSDMVMMQELIWKIRPDFIIECGVAHGGSTIFYASILELIGKGRVIGVDVEIRKHNRLSIQSHPMSKRIELIEGSSVDKQVLHQVKSRIGGAQCVAVVLDSNHSREHVFKELEMYWSLVTPGSYLVVMDGAQANVSDIPRGKAEWRDDNPLVAMRDFLKNHPEFRSDPYYTRMHITSNPEGFLRRSSTEES
jgi:cephalosporin hydroxylase